MEVTKDFIFEAATKLEEFYNQRNTNMLVWREIALMTKESYWVMPDGQYKPPEDGEMRIILPIAFNTIESYLSLMLTRPPVVSVPASEIKEVHQQDADKIEKMLYAIWHKSSMNKVIRDALWHALVDGWGVIQVCYDPERDLEGECPIFAASVDPLGFYPMPAKRAGEWEYVVLIENRLVGDLRNAFILGRDRRTKAVKSAETALAGFDDTDRVKVLEYWDSTVHAFMIIPIVEEAEEPQLRTGEWLLPPTKHDFGKIPFVVWHGTELPFRDRGERIGISVLFPLEGIIRYACQLISQKATIIARYADPTLVTKTAEGRGFDVPQPYGGQLPLEIGEDAGFLLPPGVSPSVDIQLNEVIAQIEQAGLPRHVMGQLTTGRLSGIAMNLLRTPVLMKIAYKQECIEEGLERLNEIILRTVENYVARPVYLWGRSSIGAPIEVSLDPAIIGGYYRNQVKLSASLPTDEAATTAMLTALRQTNVLSSRTVRDVIQQTLRDLVSQSLENEEDQILIETLLSMPEIQLALAQDVAREAGVRLPEQMMGGGAEAPMQGAIPGFGGGEMAPQQTPWSMQGRGTPTGPDMIRRLAQLSAEGAGGRPIERPVEAVGLPSALGAMQGF